MNETTMTIVGNLTADPDLSYTPNGVALCKFTVASTPRQYDTRSGAWKDGEPLFMACTAWRDLAENTAESLHKGTRVVITGRVRMSQWETETGEKRISYGLDVEEIGASLRFAQVAVKKLTRTHTPAAA